MRTLRVLAILTKRQMADDGPYLVAALLIPTPLIFATAVWAFFDDPYVGINRHLPFPTACLLAVLVLFLCAGSYLFATRQVQADRANGVSAMLSALPVWRGHVLLARTLIAALFLIVVLIFLSGVITGAVLFLSVFLIALACHCLGLRKACAWSPLSSTLDCPLLIMVLILLVIIKGLGLPDPSAYHRCLVPVFCGWPSSLCAIGGHFRSDRVCSH